MTTEIRVVLDTNVIVSAALLPRSVSRQAVDLARTAGRIILSPPVIAELDEVLRRDRFDRYVTEEERLILLAGLIREATLIEPTEAIAACRDPKDDKYLELAVAGEATCIVTGDRDLLILDPFRGIPILGPRAFLDRYSNDPAAESPGSSTT